MRDSAISTIDMISSLLSAIAMAMPFASLHQRL